MTPNDVFESLPCQQFRGNSGKCKKKTFEIWNIPEQVLLCSPVPQVCGSSPKPRIKKHVVLRVALIKLQLTFVCIIDRAAMLGGWLVISPMYSTVSVSVSAVVWLQYKV